MTTGTAVIADVLTHDEHKAAEAAFRGLPMDPSWSGRAQKIYFGILSVTNGHNIVARSTLEPLAVGGRLDFEGKAEE